MTEDELRERLHAVDELTPPEAGFESKVLAAGRARLGRRRAWTSGLAGAAAVVAVVTLAAHLPFSSGSSSATSAAGAGPAQDLTPAQLGTAESGAGAPEPLAGNDRGGGSPAPAPTSTVRPSPTTISPTGSAAFDWNSAQATAAIAGVRATLSAPSFADVFTALSVDHAGNTPHLVVYLTRFDASAMRAAVAGFPPGTPIAFAQSAYSATACASRLAGVQGDGTRLGSEGYRFTGLSCDETGRVAVRLAPGTATQGQVDALQTSYGDAVTVLP